MGKGGVSIEKGRCYMQPTIVIVFIECTDYLKIKKIYLKKR